jgi:hypothetical protein
VDSLECFCQDDEYMKTRHFMLDKEYTLKRVFYALNLNYWNEIHSKLIALIHYWNAIHSKFSKLIALIHYGFTL